MVDGERRESPLVTVLGGAPSCAYPRRHLPSELRFSASLFCQLAGAAAFCRQKKRSADFLGGHSAAACAKGRLSLMWLNWTPTVFKTEMPSTLPPSPPRPAVLEI